jgi:glycosyltransferase involved in cell wall biosynthesis
VLRASVIVPARDAAATLPQTLAAIVAQRLEGEFEIIVVDDASTDDTGRIAAAAGATVLRNSTPLGPGRSRNLGVAAAAGPALAFTDADCTPAPGWLAAGVRALDHAGLVQGRVEPDPEVEFGPFDRTLWATSESGLFRSANLFVCRDVFDRVGGFDDGLLALAGAHFGEDVVFGWRARRAGVTTSFCDQALVYHAVLKRGPAAFVRERRREGLFAILTREVPELRETVLYRHWFLSRRSASFALALGGALVSVTSRVPAVAVVALLPYGRLVLRDGIASGARVALVRIEGDAVGFASLVRGSARARTLVL